MSREKHSNCFYSSYQLSERWIDTFMATKISEKIFLRLKAFLSKRGVIVAYVSYRRIIHGQKIYEQLIKKYGEDTIIYVQHYPGTGDVYITCALLQKFHHMNYGEKNYVITLIGQGAAKIAGLLGVDRVELLTQKDSDAMISFCQFMGGIKNFNILHYKPIAMHTGILDMLAGYHDLDFMTMYLSTVFKGMRWEDAETFPKPHDIQNRIDEYFEEKGLQKRKTVILFPFANTIEDLPLDAWERLARHLRELGFSVCTNAACVEQVIPGTKKVFVPYEDIIPFVEEAGYVVSIRSGICDIIAAADCKEFILYPTPNFYKFGVGTIFDYFSLKKMNIGKHLCELEFERIYTDTAFRFLYEKICQSAHVESKKYVPMAKENTVAGHVFYVQQE